MSDLFYEEDLAFHRARVAAHEETKHMWVYVESRSGMDRLYTVGYYKPPIKPDDHGCWTFNPVEDFGREGEAQMMVHYLNGGQRGV